jgi:hypothetical protein
VTNIDLYVCWRESGASSLSLSTGTLVYCPINDGGGWRRQRCVWVQSVADCLMPNGNGPTPVGCSLSPHLGFHVLDPQRNMSLPAIIDVLSQLILRSFFRLLLFDIWCIECKLDEKLLFGMEIMASL